MLKKCNIEILKQNDVPVWHKFALTIEEASDYFGIGTKKLRLLANENLNGNFVLQNGAKLLIKRERFEDFLNETYSI